MNSSGFRSNQISFQKSSDLNKVQYHCCIDVMETLPFQDVGWERFSTDVRHRVFLYPEVILLKSLSGCGWSSLIPVVVHLSTKRINNLNRIELIKNP